MDDVRRWAEEVKKLGEFMGPVVFDFREFILEEGRAFGWSVYKDDDFQCVKSFMTSGAKFPVHDHIAAVETLIMLEGSGTLICENRKGYERREFVKRVPMYLEQGQKHRLEIKENAVIVVLFVPPEKAM